MGSFENQKVAEVILSIVSKNTDKTFDYLVPPELADAIKPGMRVTVPLGANRFLEAYVVLLKEDSEILADKLKPIKDVKDEFSVFSENMMELARFMQKKYYTTLSNCLQTMLPVGLSLAAPKLNFAYLTNSDFDVQKLNEKQRLVVDFLKQNGEGSVRDLKKNLGISQSPIDSLAKKGIIRLEPVKISRNPINPNNYQEFKEKTLLHKQQQVFDELIKKTAVNYIGNKICLIHGVTGSGKTEIYLQLIDKVISEGKQAIMLVPEIALTPQTVQRFFGRFGTKVSVTHSRLSDGERYDQWKRAKDGEISVMIGPRSAIFTPFDNLGAIIIDEEHETSYKSESTPKYAVKELAAELSRLSGAVVVFGTATPSVETYYDAMTGKIELFVLEERINKSMPSVKVVDMRFELARGNKSIFCSELLHEIGENLSRKELTILFLNRRGYSTFVSCRACGEVLACNNCSINYTYHQYSDKLVCHYCGDEIEIPDNCPVCGSQHIKYFGAGTEKIEDEIVKFYPLAKTLRMDMDTTSEKNSHDRIYRSFLNGEADILVGTQMIAKGLDFPKVTLVGIIAADINIHMGDFRSAERAFQLITQVSGRAGRAELDGRVFIQTYNPDHYCVRYAANNDFPSFYEHETKLRKQMHYPPFSHLFSIMFYGEDEKNVISKLHKLYGIMLHFNKKAGFEILPPTPASVVKIKKNYRYKVIIKADDEERLKAFAFYCMDRLSERESLLGISADATLDPLKLP